MCVARYMKKGRHSQRCIRKKRGTENMSNSILKYVVVDVIKTAGIKMMMLECRPHYPFVRIKIKKHNKVTDDGDGYDPCQYYQIDL